MIATTEIPVCDKCWKASKPWWIAFTVCLGSAFIGGILFAIAQDKHVAIPKVFAFVLLAAIAAAVGCAFIAGRRSPVRLVPNKIDRLNIRIKFLNDAYADAFLKMNKERDTTPVGALSFRFRGTRHRPGVCEFWRSATHITS